MTFNLVLHSLFNKKDIWTHAGETGDEPTGGKSSKLLKLSFPTDGGETCSLILPYPPPLPDFLPPLSHRPFSSLWCPPVYLPWPPIGMPPPLLLRPLCDWRLGLCWRSGGETIKSPRLIFWLGRRSEPGGLEAGLHVVEKEGLLKALTPLRQWDSERPAASHSCPGDTDVAGENSWTRLALLEPAAPPAADLQPLLSAKPWVCAAGRGRLGVLAGVAGPWVRAWLLWSLKKFKRNGTNSCLQTVTTGSPNDSLSPSCRKRHTKATFIKLAAL